MFQYSMQLVWSDEDEGYVATVPEFPGLSAFGDTPEEAIAEAKTAVEGFVATLSEDGENVPVPQKVRTYSGQIRLRLPASLHERLAKEAERDGVSLNSYMLYVLSGNIGAAEAIATCTQRFENMLQTNAIRTPRFEALDVNSQVLPLITTGAFYGSGAEKLN